MPEVESIYGGDDNEDYLSEEDDDDDGVGFGMLGGKFRLAGPGSSSVRRLSCRLKKSFSTPSFKSFLDNNVAAASLLLSPPPAQQPRLPTYPNKFEAVQDVNEDDEDDEEDSDDNIFHHWTIQHVLKYKAKLSVTKMPPKIISDNPYKTCIISPIYADNN